MIHVCSLALLYETVEGTGARHVVTLLKDTDRVQWPDGRAPPNHLILGMDDIVEPMDGYIHPAEEHVNRLIEFVRGWDRANPLVVHCYAGISRSTASAYIIAAALAPQRCEVELAETLRALSPTATPNPRLIAVADALLDRNGRMTRAIEAIGRGAEAFEGTPFELKIDG
jgi:predicted protein tyrosine phosphatase